MPVGITGSVVYQPGQVAGPGGIFGSRDASVFQLRPLSHAELQARQDNGD
jgi:hypothetical protein